jgi:hypothetical protein
VIAANNLLRFFAFWPKAKFNLSARKAIEVCKTNFLFVSRRDAEGAENAEKKGAWLNLSAISFISASLRETKNLAAYAAGGRLT